MSDLWDAGGREKHEARLVRQVLEQLDYVPHTGMLVMRVGKRPVTRRKAGMYGSVVLLGDSHSSAKLVWVWHHKALPPCPLRHVNGRKDDDRIDNLGFRSLGIPVSGAGKRWVWWGTDRWGRRQPNGSFRSYEKAMAACESHQRGEDLV